jgi:hypothetical protein
MPLFDPKIDLGGEKTAERAQIDRLGIAPR